MSPNPGQNGAHIDVHSSTNDATGIVISGEDFHTFKVWSNYVQLYLCFS